MAVAIISGCGDSDCRPDHYLYTSTLELLSSQCERILGSEASLIGYLYDDSPDATVHRYLLLPGSDYAEMAPNSLSTAVMLVFPEDPSFRLPEECIDRMVTVTGTIGTFSGIPAVRDVLFVTGPEGESCYAPSST